MNSPAIYCCPIHINNFPQNYPLGYKIRPISKIVYFTQCLNTAQLFSSWIMGWGAGKEGKRFSDAHSSELNHHSFITYMIVWKSSSTRIMSAASLQTSVPVWPIATPMSAAFRATASFTPSPVMATTDPFFWRDWGQGEVGQRSSD